MDAKLRKLQLCQLEILKVIDEFCQKEGIKYSLYAGTLLGAVRHHGFIPWDDDLDICMERAEFNRFLDAWKERGPAGYLLQNKDNTPRFPQSFTKIRKEHTTFLQNEREATAYHTGIFVDVFPIDRMPSNRIKRSIFEYDCMRYQLYCREFVPPKGNAVQKAVSFCLLTMCSPVKRARKRASLLKRITKGNKRKGNTVAIETLNTILTPLPENLFDGYTRLPFEDGEYMCFSNWDGYLRAKFGDYMTLPPESERTWKHHPIILDFEHDYEELQQINTDRLP